MKFVGSVQIMKEFKEQGCHFLMEYKSWR